MMEDKDWLKGLENKLKDYEEPAPEGLWEGIESSVFTGRKRRATIVPLLWRSAAAAAVVALGVFAGLRLRGPADDGGLRQSQEALASASPSSVINDGSPESSPAKPVEIVPEPGTGSLLADSGQGRVRRKTMESVAESVEKEKIPSDENSLSAALAENPDELPSREVTEEYSLTEEAPEDHSVGVSSKVDGKSFETVDHEGEDWSDYISATSEPGKSGRKAAVLDLSFSEGAMGSSEENSFDLQMFYRGSAPASAPGLLRDPADNPEDNGCLQTRSFYPMSAQSSTQVDSRAEHRRPVRVALTVNYSLGGVFGVETGAVLTRLRSTFTTEVGRTSTETAQTLTYVGVPLNATASLFGSKRFSVYVSGGGMAEKCVSAKTVTTDLLDGMAQGGSVSDRFKVKPLLWSLNASAGLQANLTRNFGIYVEPGLSYHFDDGSDTRTIYKDRPLDFALTFGARFLLR